MVENILASIITWVQSLGYMGVFYGALLEEIFYVIPSSIVQLTAGAILLGDISFSWELLFKSMLWVGIPASVGVTIGSLPYYALGYYGGKPAIEKWGKWLGVTWQSVEDLNRKLTRTWWDEIIFTGLRALPILPSVALSVGPGIFRMSLRTYFIGSFIGTFIRATAMGFVGSRLGAGASDFSQTIEQIQGTGTVILIITCAIAGGFWWYYRTKKKKYE